mmetsp:Transcript_22063/g.47765  ORF Transcript_22063/g.47765 Transcript_22063/m.47765 type:complete len:295 (-) Transcript_22063:7-891(-)
MNRSDIVVIFVVIIVDVSTLGLGRGRLDGDRSWFHNHIINRFVHNIILIGRIQNFVGPNPKRRDQDPHGHDHVQSQKGGGRETGGLMEAAQNGKDGRASVKGGGLGRHEPRRTAAATFFRRTTCTTTARRKQIGQMQRGHLNAGSGKSQEGKANGQTGVMFEIRRAHQSHGKERGRHGPRRAGTKAIQNQAKKERAEIIAHGAGGKNAGKGLGRIMGPLLPEHGQQGGPTKNDAGAEQGLDHADASPKGGMAFQSSVTGIVVVIVVVVIVIVVVVVVADGVIRVHDLYSVCVDG